MRKILLIAFLISSFITYSQEKYKVIYDYNTENISYHRLNQNNQIIDTLLKPRIKRNGLVAVELQNVNPFAVNVITEVTEENLQKSEGGGFNFSSLLGGISAFSGNKLNLNLQNLPADSIFTRSKSRGQAAINRDLNEFNQVTTTVSALKNTLLSNLLNPNLDKETILSNINTLAGKTVDSRLSDPRENFYLYLSNVESVVESSKNAVQNEIMAIQNDITQSTQSEDLNTRGALTARNTVYTDLQNLMSTLNSASAATTQDLDKIKSLYAMLEASSFKQTYDYEMEADKVNINLKFVQSDFSQEADTDNSKNTLRTRDIKLYSKGGFKINSGVALTLNNFGSSSNDYFIDSNGVIGADNNDFFVPNLSTMINFYPVIGDNFNLGGSFGISIPISSNLSGINFLLGPSVFLGSTSKLSLSGGLAYGPVQRLKGGVNVGDTTTARDLSQFTRNIYDLGYFAGISFSLFDIK